jgi:hypothetical protein
MARALLGYVGPTNEQGLLIEIARLRRRVTDLEAEVAELGELREAGRAELELELHRMAKAAEPALT